MYGYIQLFTTKKTGIYCNEKYEVGKIYEQLPSEEQFNFFEMPIDAEKFIAQQYMRVAILGPVEYGYPNKTNRIHVLEKLSYDEMIGMEMDFITLKYIKPEFSITTECGDVFWFANDPKSKTIIPSQKLHRNNKGKEHLPAIIRKCGMKEWYYYGKLHRVDGPAIVNGFRKEWYIDGKRERNEYTKDGKPKPALITHDGTCYWYEDNIIVKKSNKCTFDINGDFLACYDDIDDDNDYFTISKKRHREMPIKQLDAVKKTRK